MYALTGSEAQKLLADSADSGWSLQNHVLSPLGPESCCVKVSIPDAKYSIRVFTRDVMNALDDFYTLSFTTIYLTEWSLGTSDFDQIGWKTVELMRRGYSEQRSLEVAPVQVFRYDEKAEATAFLVQVFLNQWSAILISGPVMFFIYIDEETIWFHLKDPKVAKYVSDKLTRWNPQITRLRSL
jgi:hypothetical protein